MDIKLEKGLYVVAVSGGVDSIVLLDLLSKHKNLKLLVAHLDHGTRDDSIKDKEFVRKMAKKYGLAFESKDAKLGKYASEDTARRARYSFLESVRQKHNAKAIITAHHEDDLIETAVLNMLRGTGRRGLSSITDNELLKRPLLNVSKNKLIEYAITNGLQWREDSTNSNTRYLRNRVRKTIKPNLEQKRIEILKILRQLEETNRKANSLIAELSMYLTRGSVINRAIFIELPYSVQAELTAYWLRELGLKQFDKQLINRIVLAIKTASAATQHPVKGDTILNVGPSTAHFIKKV